jgi:hypothetical protein
LLLDIGQRTLDRLRAILGGPGGGLGLVQGGVIGAVTGQLAGFHMPLHRRRLPSREVRRQPDDIGPQGLGRVGFAKSAI